MSVSGLKSSESSYCVFKSRRRADRKFSWKFCLVLRNSLPIKSHFLGSVIFMNDLYLLALFYFFEHGVEYGFEHGFKHDV